LSPSGVASRYGLLKRRPRPNDSESKPASGTDRSLAPARPEVSTSAAAGCAQKPCTSAPAASTQAGKTRAFMRPSGPARLLDVIELFGDLVAQHAGAVELDQHVVLDSHADAAEPLRHVGIRREVEA